MPPRDKAAVDLDAELHEKLKRFAKLTGSTVRAVLERLINGELDRRMLS